ncbi:MAG TPA: class I SAM-dependent methyltransferase [Tepidisphaeraceae bacterium]|jgi:SAM-dependent methyltransferase
MPKIEWTTEKTVTVGPHTIACAPELELRFDASVGWNEVPGIRKQRPLRRNIKRVLWPLLWARDYYLVNGFAKRQLGRWIKQYVRPETTFLEVGCGPLSLRRFLPQGLWYNGLDVAFSEFQLLRISAVGRINLCLASATNIPVKSDSVDLMACNEVLMHIRQVESVIDEVRRIASPGGKFLCSIANVSCHKYQKKGKNTDFVQDWTFEGFKQLMANHGFRCLDARMMGWWMPLPLWLTKTSYQLPLESKEEAQNTNFMYAFEVQK